MSPKAQEKTEALAVAQTGGLSIPDYLQPSMDGREQISSDDLSLPRLMVAGALTRQVQDGNVQQGALFDNISGNVLFDPKAGVPLKGVFLAIRRQRTKFRPKGQGDGIECFSPDGNRANQANGIVKGVATNDCSVCEYAQFSKAADGTIVKPSCTEYREFLALFDGYPLPLVVSFGKSNSKTGKKLLEKLNADMGMTGRPLYAFQYALSSVQMESKGNRWWGLKVDPAGFPTEALFIKAKALYEKHKHSLKKMEATGLQGESHEETAVDTGPAV